MSQTQDITFDYRACDAFRNYPWLTHWFLDTKTNILVDSGDLQELSLDARTLLVS